MEYSHKEIHKIMNNELYPLSNKYDPDWIIQNWMGSHCLWLQEALAKNMNLLPNQHVLDLGCGKALSSIFLAREYGVNVWAADLWNNATDNFKRIQNMYMEDKVYPIHADANDLPFADDYFDAFVSINALFFFTPNGQFLKDHIFRHVKPGGEIGVVVPGFYKQYDPIPDDLKPHWHPDMDKWYTLEWWKDAFLESGMVDIIIADTFPNQEGNAIYRKSTMIVNAHENPFYVLAMDNITFIRIIAKRI